MSDGRTIEELFAAIDEALGFQPRDMDAAFTALSTLETRIASLKDELLYAHDAIRVYSSRFHLCSMRPCSCGAYSALGDVLARAALSREHVEESK